MKMTFPHMGTAYIPFRALVTGLGYEAVVPPQCTQRTLALGTRNAPESACLPLKINIGNYLEAQEAGATTVLMAGGIGPCRFGLYGQVQKEILGGLGTGLDMIILEPPQGSYQELLCQLTHLTQRVTRAQFLQTARLVWAKFVACDRLERATHRVRASEGIPGDTTRTLWQALNAVDRADTLGEVAAAVSQGLARLQALPTTTRRLVPVVGVVGEIYTLLEPFVNFRLEERLGELGVSIRRQVWFSDWIRHHLILRSVGINREKRLLRLAKPYLTHFVGGHGLESVAHSVDLARAGVDGIVHVLPFTCMPEIVAQSVLPQISRDYQIPILTIVIDEHAAETGIHTRLEAFVDLLKSRRKAKTDGQLHLQRSADWEVHPLGET